jgi:hypothetical protein
LGSSAVIPAAAQTAVAGIEQQLQKHLRMLSDQQARLLELEQSVQLSNELHTKKPVEQPRNTSSKEKFALMAGPYSLHIRGCVQVLQQSADGIDKLLSAWDQLKSSGEGGVGAGTHAAAARFMQVLSQWTGQADVSKLEATHKQVGLAGWWLPLPDQLHIQKGLVLCHAESSCGVGCNHCAQHPQLAVMTMVKRDRGWYGNLTTYCSCNCMASPVVLSIHPSGVWGGAVGIPCQHPQMHAFCHVAAAGTATAAQPAPETGETWRQHQEGHLQRGQPGHAELHKCLRTPADTPCRTAAGQHG